MPVHDPFLFRQLQVIQKIIEDETWLEAERRGAPVPPDDRAVRENVCRVVLRIGQQMREMAMAAIAREHGGAVAEADGPPPNPSFASRHPEAA